MIVAVIDNCFVDDGTSGEYCEIDQENMTGLQFVIPSEAGVMSRGVVVGIVG